VNWGISWPKNILNETYLFGYELYEVARDNVIFEFGLFLGSSGLNRAFLLAEEGINLPTDLDGITIAKFSLEDDRHNSINALCEVIKYRISAISKGSDLGFLPSTALAIGYYYNFVRKVCEEIHESSKVVTGEKDTLKEIKVKDFRFNVVLPANIDDNGVDSFKALYHKKNGLHNASTGTIALAKRGYPFVFKINPPGQDENGEISIEMYDVPATLNTIIEALKLFMPKEQVGQSPEVDHLERRELENFAKVLRYLVAKNVSTKSYVNILEGVEL